MHKLAVEYYSDLYTVDESDSLYRAELFQNLSMRTAGKHRRSYTTQSNHEPFVASLRTMAFPLNVRNTSYA